MTRRAAPLPAAAVALALLTLLSGCMAGGPRAAAAALRFDGVAFDVATTPDEPNEPRSPLRVAWGAEGFGIEAQAEADLARRTVVLAGEAFTSSGLAWVRHERSDVGRSLSNRLLLWDLPRLLADSRLEVATRTEGDLENTTARGRLELNGAPVDVSLWVRSRDGVPLDAWLASPQGRESPFRFLP
ncbi:MAG TPA: hypothetical protein VHI93_04880, partial [Candidatus Thermoplasmatota archaeon]|nr:hypothetical protein [Candidatus Thermoplasmatota archaeon]